MALCVQLDNNGRLSPTGQSVDDCTAYVLLSPVEANANIMITQALQPPSAADAALFITAPFSFILGCFVIGRIVGLMSNFFNRSN